MIFQRLWHFLKLAVRPPICKGCLLRSEPDDQGHLCPLAEIMQTMAEAQCFDDFDFWVDVFRCDRKVTVK